jgi:hypothetical protein
VADQGGFIRRNLHRLAKQFASVENIFLLGDFRCLSNLCVVQLLEERHVIEDCVVFVQNIVLQSFSQ